MTEQEKKKQIGRIIKAERIKAGYDTQAEFAYRIGCSNSHLSDLEQGNRKPSFSDLEAMARVCGISVTRFFPEIKDYALPENHQMAEDHTITENHKMAASLTAENQRNTENQKSSSAHFERKTLLAAKQLIDVYGELIREDIQKKLDELGEE